MRRLSSARTGRSTLPAQPAHAPCAAAAQIRPLHMRRQGLGTANSAALARALPPRTAGPVDIWRRPRRAMAGRATSLPRETGKGCGGPGNSGGRGKMGSPRRPGEAPSGGGGARAEGRDGWARMDGMGRRWPAVRACGPAQSLPSPFRVLLESYPSRIRVVSEARSSPVRVPSESHWFPRTGAGGRHGPGGARAGRRPGKVSEVERAKSLSNCTILDQIAPPFVLSDPAPLEPEARAMEPADRPRFTNAVCVWASVGGGPRPAVKTLTGRCGPMPGWVERTRSRTAREPRVCGSPSFRFAARIGMPLTGLRAAGLGSPARRCHEAREAAPPWPSLRPGGGRGRHSLISRRCSFCAVREQLRRPHHRALPCKSNRW